MWILWLCKSSFPGNFGFPAPKWVQFSFGRLHWRLRIQEKSGRKSMTDAGELEAHVSKQVVTALKAHDAVRTGTLRLIKNAQNVTRLTLKMFAYSFERGEPDGPRLAGFEDGKI